MPLIVRSHELPRLPGPFEVRITVRAEQTGGAMGVIEETLRPGTFITPHTHANDVWVLVHSGGVGALVGDEIAEAGPGDWLLKPRGVPHAMWNSGAEPAHVTEILTPGGSERWFEEMRDLTGGAAEFDALAAKHGIVFDRQSPWTERLRRRYGLD